MHIYIKNSHTHNQASIFFLIIIDTLQSIKALTTLQLSHINYAYYTNTSIHNTMYKYSSNDHSTYNERVQRLNSRQEKNCLLVLPFHSFPAVSLHCLLDNFLTAGKLTADLTFAIFLPCVACFHKGYEWVLGDLVCLLSSYHYVLSNTWQVFIEL